MERFTQKSSFQLPEGRRTLYDYGVREDVMTNAVDSVPFWKTSEEVSIFTLLNSTLKFAYI
jgi:hypothetical protein